MEMNIEMRVGGLVCDNTECDWEDMSIPEEDYPKWVNVSCPKCGENLLTEEDYQNVLLLNAAVSLANGMSEEEINHLTRNLDFEKLKTMDIFSMSSGLENLDPKEKVVAILNTHNGIKITEIKRADEN